VTDLLAVGIEAYGSLGLPENEARAAFSHPSGLFDGSVRGFIAYLDGKPASIALTVLSGQSAGVCWVGTVPRARGKGLGELCTRLATNAGFECGARIVTLQASEQGYPIYARMGFREYDRRIDLRKPK
jgi:ribosomal protein S18 acetylase RimI-like enzyme